VQFQRDDSRTGFSFKNDPGNVIIPDVDNYRNKMFIFFWTIIDPMLQGIPGMQSLKDTASERIFVLVKV